MTKSNNLNRADVVKIDNIPDSENEKQVQTEVKRENKIRKTITIST